MWRRGTGGGFSVGWALSSSSSASSQRSPPTAPASTVEIESLKITIDSEWGVRTAPGYLPVRFDITNLGEPRVIEIVGQGTRFFRTSRGGQPGGTRVRQAVRLARGDRAPDDDSGPDLRRQREHPVRDSKTIACSNVSMSPARAAAARLTLRRYPRRPAATPFGSAASGWPRPATGPPALPFSSGSVRIAEAQHREKTPVDFILEPARLPANWLGNLAARGADRAEGVGAAERRSAKRPAPHGRLAAAT